LIFAGTGTPLPLSCEIEGGVLTMPESEHALKLSFGFRWVVETMA